MGNHLLAQGTFSGSFRSLVGKTYQDEKQLTILQGFTSRGGSVLSDGFSGSWFIKGNLVVVLFESINQDNSRSILDVLEIKNVAKGHEISIADCLDGQQENGGIVALVQTSHAERFKAIKAWYFNRDKIRIESFSAAKVTCIGMVGED